MRNQEKKLKLNPIPVSLLTGFLGSGKTTVLNHLLQQPGMNNTAVIVNEFGEIGLDHEFVVGGSEDMVLLNNGCLCCTVRGDLVNTLRDLIVIRTRGETPPFEKVLIETTGLADPAPILHTLMGDDLITQYYRLDGVITTIDAAAGETTLDTQYESVKQVAVADRLLITKSDLVNDKKIDEIRKRLTLINPAAPSITVLNGNVSTDDIFGCGLYDLSKKIPDVDKWLKEEEYAVSHKHQSSHLNINKHDDNIRAFCVTYDQPIRLDSIEQWFDLIMLLKGPDLLRIKGIVNILGMDGPIIIHGVQHIFHPPVELKVWPAEDRRTRIVFITRNVDKGLLEESLKTFSEKPSSVAY